MKEVSIKSIEIDKENEENFKVVNQVCMFYSIGIFLIFIFNLFMDEIYRKYDYPNFIFTFLNNLFQLILLWLLLTLFVKEKNLKDYKDKDFGIKKICQFFLINFGLHYIFFYVGCGINILSAKLLTPLLMKLIT